MEGLLILIAIYVLPVIVKKVIEVQKKKADPPDIRRESEEIPERPSVQGSLQDLIRQFEEAQRQASQGTLTPETPPINDLDDEEDEFDDSREDFDDEEDVDLPVVTPANPNRITFKEIAESVIQWEEVSVEYLEQAFGFSDATAKQVLAELQSHHIVGRDMGEGFCDLLVHDKTELENLFKREQREAKELQAAQAQEAALHARREAELKHQQELAELEERARQLREQAGQINDGSESIEAPCLVNAGHHKHTRSFNKAEIRRGFVWAKILDEPRFKKKWNSRVR